MRNKGPDPAYPNTSFGVCSGYFFGLGASSCRQSLEGRQAVKDMMESLSMVKIAICGLPKRPGSSSVPIFKMMAGKPGRWVALCVPHSKIPG
jgi:hypothetical protein